MEHDRKSKGWSPGGPHGEPHHETDDSGGRPCVSHRLLAIVAFAAATLFGSSAWALRVTYARPVFADPNSPDAMKLKGYLDEYPPSLDGFETVRVDVGPFSETIPVSAFRRIVRSDGSVSRYYYRQPSEKVRKREFGVDKLQLRLSTGRFDLSIRRGAFGEATNPMPFRIVLGPSDQCVMVPFNETPALVAVNRWDPVTGALVGRDLYIDGHRHNRWIFAYGVPQTRCEIKDLIANPTLNVVNRPATLRLQARIPNPSVTGLQLLEVDDQLQQVGSPRCNLFDSGDRGDGDDFAGDHVYSCLLHLFESEPRTYRWLVRGYVDGVEVSSPSTVVDFVAELLEEDAAVMIESHFRAREIVHDVLQQYGNTEDGRSRAIALIHPLPLVRDVAANSELFTLFLSVDGDNGIMASVPIEPNPTGALLIPPGAMSSVPSPPAILSPVSFAQYENVNTDLGRAASIPDDDGIKSNKVVVWAPFYDVTLPSDGLNDLRHRYATSGCPEFQVSLVRDQACTLDSVRDLINYGTIIIDAPTFNPREPLFSQEGIPDRATRILTREPVTAAGALVHEGAMVGRHLVASQGVFNLPKRRTPDLEMGFEPKTGEHVWAFRPEFIHEIEGRFPESVVFAGAPYSNFQAAMGLTFLTKGARAFVGVNGDVSPDVVRNAADSIFNSMLDGQSIVRAYADYLDASPVGTGGTIAFTGDGSARYGITTTMNGGFETGTLRSWGAQGNVRVLDHLHPYTPSDGAYFALLTTANEEDDGDEDGSVEQSVCVPAGTHTLRFEWNFLSAGFREFCFVDSNDRFRVRVNGTIRYERSLDGLCTSTLSRLPDQIFGDGDDVYAAGWRPGAISLSSLTGGNQSSLDVTFGIESQSDHAFRSGVLVDNVRIE